MEFTFAPIIVRLPDGLKDKYDTSFNQGIFETDLRSDRLILRVAPEDYNAAHPVSIATQYGYVSAYDDVDYSPYRLEITDREPRSPVKRYVLRDLLKAGGNLSVYGIDSPSKSCEQPLVVVEDFHELDEDEDYQRGYSLRVGTMTVENLKGSWRRKGNIAEGNSYIISPATTSVSSSEMDIAEWNQYYVLGEYNSQSQVDGIWQPNTPYVSGERLAAIAPSGSGKSDGVSNGLRVILTQKYKIVDGALAEASWLC